MKKGYLLLLFAFIFSANTVIASEWVYDGTLKMYKLDNGEFVKDEQLKIDGKYYYFGEDGALLTGFQMIGKGFYVFNDDGTPKTEDIKYNNKIYHVNDRGKILNINEQQFDELESNYFAANSYNANEELNWQLELGKKYLVTLPISKHRLVQLMISTLGDKYSTDKLEYVIKNIIIDWKERAYQCAKEYLDIRDKLHLIVNREQLKHILMDNVVGDGFENNEANHGVELAYSSLGVRDDEVKKGSIFEIKELREAFLNEMIYRATGKGQSINQLIAINSNITSITDKRIQTIKTHLEKYVPKLYSLSSREATLKYLKKIGFTEEEARTGIEIANIDWQNAKIKLCVKLVMENQDSSKDALIDMVRQYGFSKTEANEAVSYVLQNTVLPNMDYFSNEYLVMDLMNNGFTEAEARDLLENIKSNDDVMEVQISTSKYKSQTSSGSIDLASSTKDKIEELKTNIVNRMITEHIFRKDLNKEYDSNIISSLDLNGYALIYAKELQGLGFQEWQIIQELENKDFKKVEIRNALLQLGLIKSPNDY